MKKLARRFLVLLIVTIISSGRLLLDAAGPNEYIWLHVDGQYIKKSPYCTDPNGIWVGCGTAARGITNPTLFASWAKSHNINCVRISFDGGNSSDVNAMVQALKAQRIYSYIDYHEYMADHNGYESDFLPQGEIWDVDNNVTGECQQWLDEWSTLVDTFKDEPWVMGYELCNEPRGSEGDGPGGPIPPITPDQTRRNYLRCLSIIRAVDTKHIVLIGNSSFSSPRALRETWEYNLPSYKQYRPDFPYDQAVFSFHGYIYDDDIYLPYQAGAAVASTIIGNAQNNFHVPFYCTETGPEIVIYGPDNSTSAMRKYQQEIIEMCGGQANFWQNFTGSDKAYPPKGNPISDGKMGWSIWASRYGSVSNFDIGYSDIWMWAAQQQGSGEPVAASPAPSLSAHHIVCSTFENNLFSDNKSTASVAAKIVDASGNRFFDFVGAVTFSISGPGTWSDGTTGNKTVTSSAGIAAIKIKVGSVPGTITVTASAAGLVSGSASLTSTSGPTKVVLTAVPNYLPADGTSKAFITGYIKDANNNTVTTALGTFHFTVTGPGTLWVTDSLPANQRDVCDNGKTYINLKAGTTPGEVTITASVNGLTSGSVIVYVGQAAPPAEDDITYRIIASPSPFVIRDQSIMKVSNLPTDSTVDVFTLSGKLVCKLKEIDFGGGEVKWGGLNSSGEPVAQGIYLYMVKTPSGYKKIGKIAVKSVE